MKVTIKDIARMAEVSITTVSLVLNDKPSRISKDKKEKIKKLAEEYHYVPNVSARSLVTKSSKILGLIIPDLQNSFFASLAKSVEEVATQNNYALMIVNTDDQYEKDISFIEKFKNLGVDGILISVAKTSYDHQKEVQETLDSSGIPFVMVDRTFVDFKANAVYFDNKQGGYLQTQYAIALGHKHIACLSARDRSSNGYYRYQGYKKALLDANITYDESYVFDGDYKYASGYERAKEILNNEKITAVVAANDLMAYGFIQYARLMGKHVPEDILVVGYDNLHFNKMMGLKLPSIDQDVMKLGNQAVNLLLDSIHHKMPAKEIVLQPILFEK